MRDIYHWTGCFIYGKTANLTNSVGSAITYVSGFVNSKYADDVIACRCFWDYLVNYRSYTLWIRKTTSSYRASYRDKTNYLNRCLKPIKWLRICCFSCCTYNQICWCSIGVEETGIRAYQYCDKWSIWWKISPPDIECSASLLRSLSLHNRINFDGDRSYSRIKYACKRLNSTGINEQADNE